MAEIASLIPLISGAAGAASSYQEGQATKMVANINAQSANLQGEDARRIGEQDAAQRLQQGGMDASSARAKAAAQGINVDTGSAAKVQGDIKAAAITDASTIRKNAAMQAWGYGVEASNYRMQGRFAAIAGWNQGAQSLISGGMQSALLYDQLQKNKKPNTTTVRPPDGKNMSDPGNR